MNKAAVKQMILPVVIIFFSINILCMVLRSWLDRNNINHNVLLNANVLLFFLGLITGFIHIQSLKSSNPYAFVRSVTLASFLKLLVIAAAVLIYLYTAGSQRSIYAVAVAMLFYIVYMIIEVRSAMRLNKNRNAKS